MTEVPFHATRIGQRFYEHTVPEVARQLSRLNDNLERLIEAANRKENHDGHDDEEGPEGDRPGSDPQAPQATDP